MSAERRSQTAATTYVALFSSLHLKRRLRGDFDRDRIRGRQGCAGKGVQRRLQGVVGVSVILKDSAVVERYQQAALTVPQDADVEPLFRQLRWGGRAAPARVPKSGREDIREAKIDDGRVDLYVPGLAGLTPRAIALPAPAFRL